MKSWDCFDTLVARRYSHPHTIFDEVGKRLNIPNFKELRISAEKKSNNTYEGIYQNLPGIDSSVEIQVEIEHCYPIIENINKVNDGDLIISDIYHTKEIVEKILISCGLTKKVIYYVTPDGKRKGWIWPTLPTIELHIGDNKKSDIKSPGNFNINTLYYTGSFFNNTEQLVSITNYELACWMKYIRLQCPYTDDHKKSLWEDQSNYNLPILALASLELPNKKIAFTYRDSVFWKPLYEQILKRSAVRFDSSRAILSHPTHEYKKYVQDTVSNCAIADLQGSGKSLLQFFTNPPEIYFIGGKIKDHPQIKSITGLRAPAIEKHNCSSEGSIIGWNSSGSIRLPVEHNQDVIEVQHTAFNVAANSVKYYTINKDLPLLKKLLEQMKNNYTDKTVTWTENHI